MAIVRVEESSNPVFEAFRAYYSLDHHLYLPQGLERREFAYQDLKTGNFTRHISLSSGEEVRRFLRTKVPGHFYYSTAFYDLPDAKSMEEKGWQGSELLFDIDLDHVEECSGHIVETPKMSAKIMGDECIWEGIRYVNNLVDILTRDLGIERGDIQAYYTGNRGFHVKASCDWCLGLGREERRLLASYVLAEALDLEEIFPRKDKMPRGARIAPPTSGDPGWRGWIARLVKEHPSDKNWGKRVLEAIERFRPPIDTQVTQDISRLARPPGTLNGKTGFLVAALREGLPLPRDHRISPFGGEVRVRALDTVNGVRLFGYQVDVREGGDYQVPAWIAIYLALRGIVELVEGDIVVRADTGWRPV
ncbi:MAG: hypothetical protein F7C07_02000 [Desulfurococcales archaeon]|nr:hypothetical protein [Desulfurococcales archaeon]